MFSVIQKCRATLSLGNLQIRSLISSAKAPPTREEIFSKYPCKNGLVKETRLESLGEETWKGNLVQLHPQIWSVRPRLDCIQENVKWQFYYKRVSYIHRLTRYEMPGGKGPRPWPQKGTGRARHRTRTSPIWIHGGKARGPQAPKSFFYMIPFSLRVNGLIHTLAVKHAQDDLHIVESLDIPSREESYVSDLIDKRNWGLSALFVDTNDIFPENIVEATDSIRHVNLMPAYGLNVHSMLKHKTLVLTLDALNHIENKLLFAMTRLDQKEMNERNFNWSINERVN